MEVLVYGILIARQRVCISLFEVQPTVEVMFCALKIWVIEPAIGTRTSGHNCTSEASRTERCNSKFVLQVPDRYIITMTPSCSGER